MGTKVFITEEDKKQITRKELEGRAISLWSTYSEEYKTLPFKYFFCLQEKRARRLKLNRLPVSVEDYPNLPLLYQARYDDLERYIKRLSSYELRYIVEDTEDAVKHNYVITSLREWLKDATYLIKRHDEEIAKKSSVPPVKAETINSPWG